MARQLTLLEVPPSWRLDDATRQAGRQGIAAARASLRAAIGTASSSDTPAGASEHRTHRRSAA